MSPPAMTPGELEAAFAEFNRNSGQLETCYQALRERVEELSRRLAEAQSARHRELVEKERLSNRLSRLLETLPGAFLVIDGAGVILERNRRASEILNRPLLGVCWADVVRREFCAEQSVDGDLRLRDGRWINLFRKPLDLEQGEILLLTDVTESRRMSRLLRNRDRLTEIGEMTASLAHQIRTPLSSALLYLSQLQHELGADSRRATLADKAGRCLHTLDGLVNDMLLYVRGIRSEGEPVDAAALLQDARTAVEPLLVAGGCLVVDTPEPGLAVRGNRDAMLGALVNLLRNALEACGERAVVKLDARRDGDEVRIAVTDNGHGIAEDLQPRLFEPFYTTRPQGTGLGLAIVRRVVEAHEGSIDLDSSARGTTFTVRLPALASDVDAMPPRVPQSARYAHA